MAPPPHHRTARHRRAALLAPVLAAVLALALALAAPVRGEGFLSALEDVPLMPGLAEVRDAGLEFEAATGRLVEAVATGIPGPRVGRAAVLEFYAETLPALGWRPEGPARFVREDEALTLAVEETPTLVTVRFAVKPR